jgi:hypothetical protein
MKNTRRWMSVVGLLLVVANSGCVTNSLYNPMGIGTHVWLPGFGAVPLKEQLGRRPPERESAVASTRPKPTAEAISVSVSDE